MTLYVDGALAISGAGPSGTVGGSETIALGRIQSGTNNYLQGSLDEVAFYNVAISAATVSSHYATGTTP
jgi:hypothetical protein